MPICPERHDRLRAYEYLNLKQYKLDVSTFDWTRLKLQKVGRFNTKFWIWEIQRTRLPRLCDENWVSDEIFCVEQAIAEAYVEHTYDLLLYTIP